MRHRYPVSVGRGCGWFARRRGHLWGESWRPPGG